MHVTSPSLRTSCTPLREGLVPRRAGFTLIELLVVIAIIMILLALLVPAVGAAKRKARQSITTAEVIAIEQAWRAYLTDYKGSPTNSTLNLLDPSSIETETIEIKGTVADILSGVNVGDNPRKRRYVEFKHQDERGYPVTAYWRPGMDDAARTVNGKDRYCYYVKLDYNFDEKISAADGADPTENPPATDLQESVAVWTYNVDKKPTDPDYIIKSW